MILNNEATELSQRLRLVPVAEEHLPLLDRDIFSDNLVMEHVCSREYAMARHQHYVTEWQTRGYGFYTLFSQLTSELIGRAGLFWATNPEGFEKAKLL